MARMKSPHKDLALLVSVVGLGLTATARAEAEPEPPLAAEGHQPSERDWVPPEAIVVAAPAAAAAVGPDGEVLKVSDWDWVPGDAAGKVAAQVPVANPDDRRAGFEPVVAKLYDATRYAVATLSLDEVQRHYTSQRAAAEEAALLEAVQAFAARVAPSAEREPVQVDRAALAAANDVDPRISAFVHDAMPVFEEAPAALAAVPSAAAEPATEIAAPVEAVTAPIVVASQADKVLLNLFGVISDEWRVAGRTSLLPEEIVVGARPTDLVALFALPAIQPPAARDFAAIDAPAEAPAPKKRKKEKKAPAAPSVVVASHIDKVLLSLNTIRSEELTPLTLIEMQPKDVAVVDKPADEPAPVTRDWVALDSSQLDRVRGGFSSEGLQISFGIQRAVYINDKLVTTTSLNLSSLGQISGGTAGVPGSLALIQSGTGNSFFSMPTANGSVTTVIQNTLNNQKIQSVTEINAIVNSMQILKGMNLQQSLRSAVIDSLRR